MCQYEGLISLIILQLMRLDSSFESLAGLASNRAGSMADLADETPRRSVHRHSYAAPSHNDPEIPTPTKPFGLGKLPTKRKKKKKQYLLNSAMLWTKMNIFYSTTHSYFQYIHSLPLINIVMLKDIILIKKKKNVIYSICTMCIHIAHLTTS